MFESDQFEADLVLIQIWKSLGFTGSIITTVFLLHVLIDLILSILPIPPPPLLK